MALIALSSCAAPNTNEELKTSNPSIEETIMTTTQFPENTAADENVISLFSGNSKITLRTEENTLFISELISPDGENLLSCESLFPLPSVANDNEISWEFLSSATLESENCSGAEFVFEDKTNALELRVLCMAYNTPGPFVFETRIKNTAQTETRIAPGSFAAIDADCTGASVWRINKESGWAEGIRRSDGGDMFQGEGIYVTPVEAGTKVRAWVNTEQNFNASGSFPLIYLDRGGKNGLLVALEWSSGRVDLKAKTEPLPK